MKKLFMQLVAEFKRMGCTIVYANFNKIILCCKKRKAEDAVANIEFVVASIRNKELFHSMEISYRLCWEQLIWLDAANYGGVQGKLGIEEGENEEESKKGRGENGEEEEDLEREDEEDDEDQEPTIVMNWNIAEQLPEAAGCRNAFNAVIAGYINAVYTRLKQVEERVVPLALSQPHIGLAANDDVATFAKELISGEISQNLFQ